MTRQIIHLVFLGDQGGGGRRLVLPVWWKDTGGLVVSGETVDTGLDQNESELGVLVLSVSLKVLSDVDSLLDQVVEILWELWGET